MKPTSLRKLKLISILLILISSCKQLHKEAEIYRVGFRVSQTIDKSRTYKPDTDTTDYLHYRPLDIDFWYPAQTSNQDSIMVFGDILGLLEKRANYYTASDAGNGLTNHIAQYFCDGVKCSDSTRVLNFKTRSHRNALPIKKKFPLVVYLSSYNGMGYENLVLFEDLVRKGFAVVSINSIGRFPGDMTMKTEDLNEQVNDALAALKYLERNENIDFSKIGIIGYSWGGLSASLLATKIPNATCIVSLDGSEFHQYGKAKEENEDFERIRNSSDFASMSLSIPYLRLERSSLIESDKIDSVYDFSEKLFKDMLILMVDSAEHEDFSCLPNVVNISGQCKNSHLYSTISKLTISFLEENIKNSKSFTQILKQELNASVREK
jgi:pimeloyl-ACP methyl ester carboxylesterase